MLNLVTTTDKLQLVTDAGITVDVHCSGVDVSGGVITPWKQNTAITTATTTDIVVAPASSTFRNVKTLHIRNKHATTAVGVTVIFDANGTDFELHKVTLAAGDLLQYIEGVGFYHYAVASVSVLQRMLTADETGQNVNTAQPWFPSAGAVTVTANTSYYITGVLYTVRAAGTTSHTTSLLFGGTASLSNIAYHAIVNTGDVDTNIAANRTIAIVGTAIVVKAASTSATESFTVLLHGMARFGAAGTFIPQFQYSAAPGGAPTVRRNSYFRVEPVGSNTVASTGPWA